MPKPHEKSQAELALGPEPEKPVEMPTTATPEQPNPAAEFLKRKTLREARQRERERASKNAENVYYLKCPRVAGHAAAWLTEKPQDGKPITPGMWHSLFHRQGDPWARTYIPCQECYYEGGETRWHAPLRALPREDGSFNFMLTGSRRFPVKRDGTTEFIDTAVGSMARAEVEGRMEKFDESPSTVSATGEEKT